NVEATVTDASGHSVHGLAAGDFRLLVDGNEVTIDHFDEIIAGNTRRAEAVADAATASAAAAESLQLERDFLVLVDNSFAVAAARNLALAALSRELAALQPQDRMAVVAFDGNRLDTLSPWTNDRAVLAAALGAATKRPARGSQLIAGHRGMAVDVDFAIVAAIESGIDPDELGVVTQPLGQRADPEARAQLGKTAAAMAGALRGFEAPPGRKLLVLLTGGWSLQIGPRLFGPLIESANRLGYTIYPLDVAAAGGSRPDLLAPLAKATGGKVPEALGTALVEVANDSGSYYWLGFDAPFRGDDKVHRIEVTMRRADLVVRSRSSYSDLSAHTEVAMKAEGVVL